MKKRLLNMCALLALALIAAAPLCAKPWGIVATGPDYYGTDNASIHIIDLGQVPPVVYGPFLQEYFRYAEALDIAMLRGNRKALVSAFQTQQVLVVDLSDKTNPVVERTFDLPFAAEDIAVSPNGKFALVTDGGSSSWVSIIDLKRSTVNSFQLGDGMYAQAVAVGKKKLAIFADYYNGAIYYGKINKASNGLESIQSVALCDEGQLDNATDCMGPAGLPVNVTVAPCGRTVLVAPALGGVVFVFKVTGKGELEPGDPFILTGLPGGDLTEVWEDAEGGQQSIAFEGKKTAYVLSQRRPLESPEAVAVPGGISFPGAEGDLPNQLSQISILGPGRTQFVAARYTLLNSPIYQYFGVDTLDIQKRYALAGNASSDIGTPFDNVYYNHVVFIDMKTGILTPIELNNFGYAVGVAVSPK